MTRRYGRALRGKRVIDAASHGHWKTTTFVAGLRAGGIVAPLVNDGPMNCEALLAFVQHPLVRELKPGDVVVMDSLAAHKVAEVAEAIRAAGASLMYLPPPLPFHVLRTRDFWQLRPTRPT